MSDLFGNGSNHTAADRCINPHPPESFSGLDVFGEMFADQGHFLSPEISLLPFSDVQDQLAPPPTIKEDLEPPLVFKPEMLKAETRALEYTLATTAKPPSST